MRFVLSVILCVGILSAVGCGGSGKTQIHEPTAEEIQQQKDAQELANAEESAMRKTQPQEKTKTHQQTVDEQERNRKR
jgi:hypothetical protein